MFRHVLKFPFVFLLYILVFAAQFASAQVSKDEVLQLSTPPVKGFHVAELQQFLIDNGYNVGKDGADGWFGPNTEGALKQFQEAMGMEASGRVTWGEAQDWLFSFFADHFQEKKVPFNFSNESLVDKMNYPLEKAEVKKFLGWDSDANLKNGWDQFFYPVGKVHRSEGVLFILLSHSTGPVEEEDDSSFPEENFECRLYSLDKSRNVVDYFPLFIYDLPDGTERMSDGYEWMFIKVIISAKHVELTEEVQGYIRDTESINRTTWKIRILPDGTFADE